MDRLETFYPFRVVHQSSIIASALFTRLVRQVSSSHNRERTAMLLCPNYLHFQADVETLHAIRLLFLPPFTS